MLTRALIVVLAVLNVSVALWWMLRGEPAPVPPPQPAGVAELAFLGAGQGMPTPTDAASAPADAALADATPAATAAAPAAPTPPVAERAPPPTAPVDTRPEPTPVPPPAATTVLAAQPAVPARCAAFGPFADQAAAQSAQQRLDAALTQTRLQAQTSAATGSRYRVLLPPAASREAAQATVARIQAAGLSDYYIISQGPETHAIALGQYRNREGAERRLAALKAAGFPAQLSGGEERTQWWLQGRLADATGAEPLRRRVGAARQQSLDCAALR